MIQNGRARAKLTPTSFSYHLFEDLSIPYIIPIWTYEGPFTSSGRWQHSTRPWKGQHTTCIHDIPRTFRRANPKVTIRLDASVPKTPSSVRRPSGTDHSEHDLTGALSVIDEKLPLLELEIDRLSK